VQKPVSNCFEFSVFLHIEGYLSTKEISFKADVRYGMPVQQKHITLGAVRGRAHIQMISMIRNDALICILMIGGRATVSIEFALEQLQ
jgi:hypothetical protein